MTYTPFTLKLHAYGLGRLQDPNWTGMELFDMLKQHVRGRCEPYLLHGFNEKGALYHLGLWLFDEGTGEVAVDSSGKGND